MVIDYGLINKKINEIKGLWLARVTFGGRYVNTF